MIPVLFINCARFAFVEWIMNHLKRYETRTRNMLKTMLTIAPGRRILIAETGHGAPLVRCSARVEDVVEVRTREEWEEYLRLTWVPVGSEYDWKETTTVKWLYRLADVRPVDPFRLPSGCRRHGRVWAEYEGSVSFE